MEHFFTLIGWLVLVVFCLWTTGFTYFSTVPTFGGALFTGKLWQRVLGVVMWCAVFYLWWWTFSLINFNFAISAQ